MAMCITCREIPTAIKIKQFLLFLGVSKIHGKQECDVNGKQEWERPTENV